MEGLITGALERMYITSGESVDTVNVDIQIDRGEPLDEMAEQELEQLGTEQLCQLALAGRITFEKYEEILMNR